MDPSKEGGIKEGGRHSNSVSFWGAVSPGLYSYLSTTLVYSLASIPVIYYAA